MANNLIPLYYAIVKLFLDEAERSTDDVIAALSSDYGSYKMLGPKDVDEALATAHENGLLDETRCDLNDADELRIYYRITEFGADMIKRYLG